MIENKNQPAFPVTEETTDRIDAGMRIYSGVSKLEFFACNAPVDIPGWFEHISPEKPEIKAPDFEDIQDAEDRKTVRSWVSDPCFDLPEQLKWFSDKTTEANSVYYQWLQKDKAARYFQWRRYYAEQLLTELSKPQP